MERDEQSPKVQLLLREVMDDVSRGAPVVVPPWERVEVGLRRVRRRRRARAASAAGAGLLAAAVVVGVGFQVDVMPDSRSAPPATTIDGPSDLVSEPTRGSLRDDEAWLKAFRQAIADTPPEEGDTEIWKPPAADDLHVLYASDVGEFRLALVEGPWRRSNAEVAPTPGVPRPDLKARDVAWRQMWYQGLAGGKAETMQPASLERPSDTTMVVAGDGYFFTDVPESTTSDSVVVVSSKPVEVRLEDPPRYEAAGTVRVNERRLAPSEPGVYEAVLRGSLVHRLRVPALRYDERLLPDEIEDPKYPESDPSPVHGERVGVTAKQAELALDLAFERANLPARGVEARLLWGGQVRGRPHSVAAVTTPSGALAVAVFEHSENDDEGFGPSPVSGAVLPQGPLEEAAIAWPLVKEWDAEKEPAPSGYVAVLGPEGAVSAAYVGADGKQLTTVSLTDGFGVAKAPAAKKVRFTGAGGSNLGEVPVRPLLGFTGAIYDEAVR